MSTSTHFSTLFLLMAEFQGQSQIPLTDICEKYLAFGEDKAKREAARGKLPFPAYRGPSQKAPWLVSVADLATFIDAQREKAIDLHNSMNTTGTFIA